MKRVITPWSDGEAERCWNARESGRLWPDIAKEMGRTVQACQNKWASIKKYGSLAEWRNRDTRRGPYGSAPTMRGRHVESGAVGRCTVSVAADSREEASAFLSRLSASVQAMAERRA